MLEFSVSYTKIGEKAARKVESGKLLSSVREMFATLADVMRGETSINADVLPKVEKWVDTLEVDSTVTFTQEKHDDLSLTVAQVKDALTLAHETLEFAPIRSAYAEKRNAFLKLTGQYSQRGRSKSETTDDEKSDKLGEDDV